MIEDAFDCRAALDDTIKDHLELEDLQLTAMHWKQLRDIKTMLKPFAEYTDFVSRVQPSIQLSTYMYLQLETTLKQISKREGDYTEFDKDLIDAVAIGLTKFNKYNRFIQGNDIHYIAVVLDPRIKYQWIRKNVADADQVIGRIRKFLKLHTLLNLSFLHAMIATCIGALNIDF
jgi:hypothetical protein